MSDRRYVLLGSMTREQAVEVAETLAGGSVVWAKGHTFPEQALGIAPHGCRCAWCEHMQPLPEPTT